MMGGRVPYHAVPSYGAPPQSPFYSTTTSQQQQSASAPNGLAVQMLQSNPSLRAEFYEFLTRKMQAYQAGVLQGLSEGVSSCWPAV
jgi:hypothetical protein